ncbi:hypothetical protein TNCV_2128641 [Trichonephila clavipes]|nr:hypothetical protein TNCV_2128641 [Trichonephila clavipes]
MNQSFQIVRTNFETICQCKSLFSGKEARTVSGNLSIERPVKKYGGVKTSRSSSYEDKEEIGRLLKIPSAELCTSLMHN